MSGWKMEKTPPKPAPAKHELARIEECSYGNSQYCWNDGYNRAVCTCGWISTGINGKDKNVALVALWDIHLRESKTLMDKLAETA